jgi:hypothetical protein
MEALDHGFNRSIPGLRWGPFKPFKPFSNFGTVDSPVTVYAVECGAFNAKF